MEAPHFFASALELHGAPRCSQAPGPRLSELFTAASKNLVFLVVPLPRPPAPEGHTTLSPDCRALLQSLRV